MTEKPPAKSMPKANSRSEMHTHSDETSMIIVHLTLSVISASDGTCIGSPVGCALSATHKSARDYEQGLPGGAHYKI